MRKPSLVGAVRAVLVATGSLLFVTPAHAQTAGANCDSAPGFVAELYSALPVDPGACIDAPSVVAPAQVVQRTTTGLFVFRPADGWTAFTDGVRTWIERPNGPAVRFRDERFEWETFPPIVDPLVAPSPPSPPPSSRPRRHTPPPGPMAPPSPTETSLGPLINVLQTLDNCGPAAVATVLRYYGLTHSQAELKPILRANNPVGMGEYAVQPYAASIGLRTWTTPGGTPALLKALVRAKLPAIVEQAISDDDPDLHYRVVQAYDDGLGQFITSDPLLGPRHAISYAEFDRLWATRSNYVMVMYPLDKEPRLVAALNNGEWGSEFHATAFNDGI